MRTVRFAFLCVMSLALVSSDAAAQEMIFNGIPGQMPFPLGQRDAKTGTARIRGRIVAADTGAPVRRAQVRITGSDLALKTSLTDGEGRYEFRDLPRGSVIAGRIVDEFGEPIADASVTAMRSAWSNGKRRLQPAGRAAQTNDLGQYRIFGLAPGDYYVSATFRGGEMAMLEARPAAPTHRRSRSPSARRPRGTTSRCRRCGS